MREKVCHGAIPRQTWPWPYAIVSKVHCHLRIEPLPPPLPPFPVAWPWPELKCLKCTVACDSNCRPRAVSMPCDIIKSAYLTAFYRARGGGGKRRDSNIEVNCGSAAVWSSPIRFFHVSLRVDDNGGEDCGEGNETSQPMVIDLPHTVPFSIAFPFAFFARWQ